MTSIEPVRALGFTAVLAARNYRKVYSPRVLLLSGAPRVIFQVAFYTFLGRFVAGAEGAAFVYVGACVHIMTIAVMNKAADAIADERPQGTLSRLQTGTIPVWAIIAVRWSVYLAEAVASAALAIVVVGAVTGQDELIGRLLLALPVFALIGACISCYAMTVSSLSLFVRADVSWSNLGSYLLLVLGGVVAPLSALGAVEPVARLLPLTNGLLALRHRLAGEPWLGLLAAEVLVGAGWLLLAGLLLKLHSRRSRSVGDDRY